MMKKFLKLCGSLILIFVLAGLVMAGIGYFTVGPSAVTNMVSNLTNGKVNLDWNGVRVNFSGINVDFDNMFGSNGRYDIGDQDIFDKEYSIWEKNVEKMQLSQADASVIKELNLELGGSEFILDESEDDFYYFEYEGLGRSQAFIRENVLYVKVLNTTVEWGTGSGKSMVVLYVPKETELETVKVSLGAGEIHAEGLKAEELEVSVGAGDVEFVNAELKDVDIQVGAGNFDLAGKVSGNISAECAMGNITLKLAGSESDFNYDIGCVSGNICIGDNEYSGLAQEKSIDNNASKNIDLECAMGNVDVMFE